MTDHEDNLEDFQWGRDGSDLHWPVRAHVEAALIPTDGQYPAPMDELLTIGEPENVLDLNSPIKHLVFDQTHAPDLVRMARDRALNTAPSDSDEVYAPIYALAALGTLDIQPHVTDLIPLFDLESEWITDELPQLLATAGAAALPPLATYLSDRSRWIYGRISAAQSIKEAARSHPDLRGEAIQILSQELSHASENHDDLNGFLVADLVALQAVEALPIIRQAYEQDAVDLFVIGDWRAVLIRLGQTPDPNDPLVQASLEYEREREASRERLRSQPLRDEYDENAAPPRSREEAKKKKEKRKAAEASRKANRQKKKRK